MSIHCLIKRLIFGSASFMITVSSMNKECKKDDVSISRRILVGFCCQRSSDRRNFSRRQKGPSIWDYWYEQEPGKFFDRVGPEKTSQVYKRYKEDIQLMKETGHNTFRTSIQWSRLIPAGTGEVNQEAVAFIMIISMN